MRILVGGYYGFGNLGDEALLAGMLTILHGHGHQVTVLSRDPDRTAREHGVKARRRLHGLPGALLGCDLLVSGGGGLLQDRSSTRSLHYYLGILRLARTLNRRVVVFGQSIGPLSRAGERSVAAALAGVPVSVRDQPSQALLARLGIESHLGADAALLLPCPDERADDGPVLLVPRGGHSWITTALAGTARLLTGDGVRCAALALHAGQDDSEVETLLRAAPGVTRLEASDYQQAISHISRARYLLSGRLHGLVLASICGRPHAGLVYDPKVSGFLSDTAAPGFGPPDEAGGDTPPADPVALAALAKNATPPNAAAAAALQVRAQAAAAWLASVIAS